MQHDLVIKTGWQAYKDGEMEPSELNTMDPTARSPVLFDKTVMQFRLGADALRFLYLFVHQYLKPKYGDGAKEFPVRKYDIGTDFAADLVDPMGRKHVHKGESWLLVDSDRFPEVEEYLERLFGENPEYDRSGIVSDLRVA
jgi:hypothetical protein